MEVRSQSFLKKSIVVALFVLLGSGMWYYATHRAEGIYTYDASLDRTWILDLFKTDWYWLISDYSKDYDPAYMLDNRASSQEPGDRGNLIIKTYRVHNKPVGFITYYERELLEGYILFLGIDKASRRKGYARILMNYAIDDLKKRGDHVIRLITRTDNERGRKLYTSLGFKQIWTDGAYIRFEKVLDKGS